MRRGAPSSAPQLRQEIDDAVCLLALLTKRFTKDEASVPSKGGIQEASHPAEAAEIEDLNLLKNFEDNGIDGIEDDVDEEPESAFSTDQAQSHAVLYRKVLDRLAETLARFKSDTPTGKAQDAKHVASTIVTIDEENDRLKIFCFKNEGLDAQDRAFLYRWKACMEGIARAGGVVLPFTWLL